MTYLHLDPVPDVVAVLCEVCGSEGQIYRMTYGAWADPREVWWGECEWCEGSGVALLATEPANEDDEP